MTYENAIGTVRSDRGPLVFGPAQPGNFAPRSFVWKVELEQALSDAVQVRAAFWQGRARDLIVLKPVTGEQLNRCCSIPKDGPNSAISNWFRGCPSGGTAACFSLTSTAERSRI